MKSIGTFFSAFLVLSLLSQSLLAKALRIFLECGLDSPKDKKPAAIADWRVVKVSKPATDSKEDEAKWENSYVLEAFLKGKNLIEVFALEGSSGDEDYNEFKVLATDKDLTRIGVSYVTIHNKLEWATLTNFDGYQFAGCGSKK